MDPHLIYQSYYDEALVERITSEKYTTFVAMPFANSFKYKADRIKDTIGKTLKKLDADYGRLGLTRGFEEIPRRSDKVGRHAHCISSTIVKQILDSNLIIVDITTNNPGALIELGIAISSRREAESILVLTQDKVKNLHFDLKHLNCCHYKMNELADILEEEILTMAKKEEKLTKSLLVQFRRNLQIDSVTCLRTYASLYSYEKLAKHHPSLFFLMSDFCNPSQRTDLFTPLDLENPIFKPNYCRFPNDNNALQYFNTACDTLIRNHLLVCDYHIPIPINEQKILFGYHMTELGWQVLRLTDSKLYNDSYANWRDSMRDALKDKHLI